MWVRTPAEPDYCFPIFCFCSSKADFLGKRNRLAHFLSLRISTGCKKKKYSGKYLEKDVPGLHTSHPGPFGNCSVRKVWGKEVHATIQLVPTLLKKFRGLLVLCFQSREDLGFQREKYPEGERRSWRCPVLSGADCAVCQLNRPALTGCGLPGACRQQAAAKPLAREDPVPALAA